MTFKKILFLILLIQTVAFAELQLPNVFSDNMILQQCTDAKIWGWTDANSSVNIQVPQISYSKTVKADKNGNWFAYIKTGKAAGDSLTIIVNSGEDTITINDILLGEVWFASGQSNMNFPLFATENAHQAVQSADYSAIRFFSIPVKTTDKLQIEVESKWQKCQPKEASGF